MIQEVTWETWSSAIASAVASVPDALLRRAAETICAADLTLTAGNGGSSALASHAAQAISKPSYKAGGGRAAVCISDNIPLLTAHANDGGWPDAFIEAARPFFQAVEHIAFLVISSSGRSPNICSLAEVAREHGYPVIALTGFSGEPLRSLSTVSLHVESSDYEVVEPVHDALLHRIQAHIRMLGST